VREFTPTEAEYGVPLPLVDVGVLRLDKIKETRYFFVRERTLDAAIMRSNVLIKWWAIYECYILISIAIFFLDDDAD